MSKKSNKKNKKNKGIAAKEKNVMILGILALVLIAVIIAVVFFALKDNRPKVKDLLDIPEGSIVDEYVDESGKEITVITDADGNKSEYYVNEDGYLVSIDREELPDGSDKVVESYKDKDGNQIKDTILPDGTTVTEVIKPNGDVEQSVDIPKTPLTTYISYGDISKSEALKTPENSELDYSKIKGYAPMYSSSDKENLVFGVKLPYKVEETGIVIESIGSFVGPYVEDASDEEVENVAAMIITNTSDKMIQYSALSFDVKSGEPLNFVITNLPANTSAIVLEKNRKYFEGNETITYSGNITAYMERDMHSSEVVASASDNLISLTNNSDKTIDTAYVYYKIYIDGGAYLGGITYRAKIENIAPGETRTQGASHYFTSNSQVLTVDIGYAE